MLYGEGSLFWVTFKVKGQDGDQSILNLKEFVENVGGSNIYAPGEINGGGTYGGPGFIPLSLQDGTFHVSEAGAYKLGDLDGNGVVMAADAFIALQIANGQKQGTANQAYAGDVNGNGSVDAADATMILYYAAHSSWPTVAEANTASMAAPQSTTAASEVVLKLSDISGFQGQLLQVTLEAENLSQWAGGEFAITYDPTVVEQVEKVMTTDDTSNFTLSYNNTEAGIVRFSLALVNDEPLSGDKALATVKMRLAPDAALGSVSALTISEARLNDLAGRDFTTSALQKDVTRQNGSVQANSILFLPFLSHSGPNTPRFEP
jgi:hypothetical protein